MNNIFQKYQFHFVFIMLAVGIMVIGYLCSTDILNVPNPELSIGVEEITKGGKREEIQRYFGYEKLLFRYITLPYDISMNVNQIGRFVDIGYIYFLLIPLLFLWRMRGNIVSQIFMASCFLLLLIIGMHNSGFLDYGQMLEIRTYNESSTFLKNTSFGGSPFAYMIACVKLATSGFYDLINDLTGTISNDKDYVTLPLAILSFFYLSLWLIREKDIFNGVLGPVYLIIVVFGFFWFALAGGIIWYGFLMICLLLFVIVYHIQQLIEIDKNKILGICGLTLFSVWIVIAIMSRVANVQPLYISDDITANLMNHSIAKYNVGVLDDENALIDDMHPDLSKTLALINDDTDALIYKIGTSFNSFVSKNHSRVFSDNQLVLFKRLADQYPESEELASVLKASNFKFIMVDLNIASLDYTPEKTLSAKFMTLVNVLYQNENLKLINTDRIVKNEAVSQGYSRAVFGEIIFNGSYAVYEIL